MDLRLLGNIELVDRDERVDLGGPVPRAVIAVLALSANQVVPLERLADAVWNGEPPASAARTLQSYIARLRRQLAPAGLTIETRKPGYLLVVDPGAIDANRFASLSDQAGAALDGGDPVAARRLAGEALALWRGPALADVAYADFAQPEIARLDEARMVTTELHVEAGLLTGKAAETAAELERLVAEHPLRERFRGQLMRALHWTGRTADALRVYQRGRQLLGEELGVEPGSDLQALEGAIIRNETSVAAPVATPAVSVGNLPVPITTFVGRQPELADLLALIGEHRLVTVSGPGGAGKTRIAVEAASRVADRFPGGAWFIDLTAVNGGDEVGSAVLRTLAIPEEAGRPLDEVLVTALAGRRCLLVLDNCEHVIAGARAVIATLLAAGLHLQVIATSRQPLGLAGEVAWPIPPMALPASVEPDSLPEALQYDAVRLLVERANAAAPDLRLGDRDVGPLLAICRQLDRLPLAIELAAGRLRALSPLEVRDRIRDSIGLLTGSGGTDRHGTLESVIGWSFDLLAPDEQVLFCRLAVFPGSFDLAAAEAVCGATAELVAALVEKSLVMRSDVVGGSSRYRLLETLRSYAGRRLAEERSGQAVGIRRRHAWYFAARAESEGARLRTRDWSEALTKVRLDLDDHRAALAWLLDSSEADTAARLVRGLWPYWHRVESTGEARHWIERTLATPGLDDDSRVDLLVAAGSAAYAADDLDRVLAAADDGLALLADGGAGGRANRARLLVLRAQALRLLNRPGEARETAARALAEAAAAGERWDEADAARVCSLLARDVADLAAAERHGGRAVELWEQIGDIAETAGALSLLGVVAADRGDLNGAHRLYQRSLTAFRAAHDPLGEAHVLWRLADIALERHEPGAALAFAQDAYHTHELMAHRRGMGQASVTAARALLVLGEVDAAEAVVTMAMGDLTAVGFAADLCQACETAGWIALAQGQPDNAIRWGERSLEVGGTPRQTVDALCVVANARAMQGDLAEARAAAERAADLARALVYPAGLARSLEALATRAAAAGDDDEAALLRRAAATTVVNGVIDVNAENLLDDRR